VITIQCLYLEVTDISSKLYTGVGSRDTPYPVIIAMQHIGTFLHSSGWVLRSGGAVGADTAFQGANIREGDEIYLPWKGFNNSLSQLFNTDPRTVDILKTTISVKHFKKLSPPAVKLHSRNVHQVLGQDLETLSKFLVCWTKDGKDLGGTATAIKLARSRGIPIINLGDITSNDPKDFVFYFFSKYRGITSELF